MRTSPSFISISLQTKTCSAILPNSLLVCANHPVCSHSSPLFARKRSDTAAGLPPQKTALGGPKLSSDRCLLPTPVAASLQVNHRDAAIGASGNLRTRGQDMVRRALLLAGTVGLHLSPPGI